MSIIASDPLHICDQGACPARATVTVKVPIVDPHSGHVSEGELGMCQHHANAVVAAMPTASVTVNA
jgi:hypothetical protein